jgi:hypothetical protein
MATLTESSPVRKPKAFYCTVYDAHGVLAKLDDGVIYFVGDDGSITEYEPEMAPWVTILGEVGLVDTQQIMDRLHGGYATIACTRRQEAA